MTDDSKLYTVKWPRSEDHLTQSQSGVFVEANLQRQVVLHFYNETREMEDNVVYGAEGERQTQPREITYIREVNNTILVSENTAVQLRDLLNAMFPVTPAEDIN